MDTQTYTFICACVSYYIGSVYKCLLYKWPSSPSSAQFIIEVVDAKDFNSITYTVRKNQTLYKNLFSNFIVINFKSLCHIIKNLFPTEHKTSCYGSSGSGWNASETN